jgi:tripartite-type tricarboxylate transporter receptor subunit TctC
MKMKTPKFLNPRTLFAGAALAVAATLTAGTAFAQDYPNKPVRLVVPFPGGSLTDTFMRVFADSMQKSLGQTILVDPKPGAGTMIGTQFALQQPADGYTMLVLTSSQEIRSATPNAPYDLRKDVHAVIATHYAPLVFAVNVEKMPNVKTVKDMVEYAKANPGKLNMGSYGAGTLSHLAQEYLVSLTGINIVHVPFGGSVADVTALARGDIQTAIEAMGTLRPHVDAGRIRVLSTFSAERFPLYPDVPGMKESGFPQYDLNSYQGFGVKAGTPRAIINKLNEAANKAVLDRTVRDHFLKVGLVLKGGTPEEYTAIIKNETDAYAKVIKERNLVIE